MNAERFTIPELKEYEERILGAEERACELEYQLFEEVRSLVLRHVAEIQQTAEAIAVLDVIAALAAAAVKNNYVRPQVSDSTAIAITGGRHPIVERMLGPGQFVDNDAFLDTGRQPAPHYHRPEHGREINLYQAGCPDRAYGADGLVCSGPGGAYRRC